MQKGMRQLISECINLFPFSYLPQFNYFKKRCQNLLALTPSRMSEYKIPKQLNYQQKQVFGNQQSIQHIQQQDIINQIQFDPTGELLAIGDNAGRIILFKEQENEFGDNTSFQYYSEFQSHTSYFDSLKSVTTSESITQIKWLRPQGNYNKMITSNTNCIKLWKMFEKTQSNTIKNKIEQNNPNEDFNLTFPLLNKQTSFTSYPQIIFPVKHQGNINQVQVAQNQQYILTTDEQTAIFWNFEDYKHPFIVEDIKQRKNWKEGQKIACSKLHPCSENIFTIGTNKGTIEINDLRISLNNRKNTQLLTTKNNQKDNDYFRQMSKRISSLQFLSQGRYIAARDYLTVKVWDICRPTQPLSVVEINPHMQQKMCTLFENDCMEDKFHISSFGQNLILTGNYDNRFHVIDPFKCSNVEFVMNFDAKNSKKSVINSDSKTLVSKFDSSKKVLSCGVHGQSKKIALASLNSFFIYSPVVKGESLREIEM